MFVNAWRRFHWDRFLLGWCAAFHLLAGLILAFAPLGQVLTEGTRPVLELASRHVWAVVFLAAAAASASLLWRAEPWRQLAAWLTVFPLGLMWLTAFTLAVLDGRGSALVVVVWPFLYIPWGLAAVRLGLGKR
jgi:hypothetical protein